MSANLIQPLEALAQSHIALNPGVKLGGDHAGSQIRHLLFEIHYLL